MRKIVPFYHYIRWDEKVIVETIQKELNWEMNPNAKSSWRGDCDIALLKLYLYKKMLGFNDRDDGLSCLVRDGQLSREEAFQRLAKEGDIAQDVINEILEKYWFRTNQF